MTARAVARAVGPLLTSACWGRSHAWTSLRLGVPRLQMFCTVALDTTPPPANSATTEGVSSVCSLLGEGKLQGAVNAYFSLEPAVARALPLSDFRSLIHYTSDAGQLESALQLLGDVDAAGHTPDVAMFHDVILASCIKDRLADGTRLLLLMMEKGMTPSSEILDALLLAHARTRSVAAVRAFIDAAVVFAPHLDQDPSVLAMLVKACATMTPLPFVEGAVEFGAQLDALRVGFESGEKNYRHVGLSAYQALLHVCAITKDLPRSKVIMGDLVKRDDIPHLTKVDNVGLVLKTLCACNDPESAVKLVDNIRSDGSAAHPSVYFHLVAGVIECNRPDLVLKVVNSMIEDDANGSMSRVLSYAFKRLVEGGHYHSGLQVLDALSGLDIPLPAWKAFSSMVVLLCRAGQVDEANTIFRRGVSVGWIPSIPACKILLWGLMKTQQWEAARLVLNDYNRSGYVRLDIVESALAANAAA